MRIAFLAVLLLCVASAALAQQPPNPRACGGVTTVPSGGTAVAPYTPGGSNGGYIVNPLSATDQGIVTAEGLYVDPTTAATTTGNITNTQLSPGQIFYFPPGINLGNLTVNAATSGHKFTCVRW